MTLRIALQFPAGRYHATPWGRHVNEGEVEWPPSPWRICRALLATGFTKAHWTKVPEPMVHIVAALARTPPVYHLPPASAAHTRHYMPVYKDSPDKVIDAFAYPGRDAVLVAEWNVDLDAQASQLLDDLLARLSYLGRAESWIEAQRIDAVPSGLTLCMPGDVPPGPEHERIGLLAPMPAEDYARWRQQTMESELARRLHKKRELAANQGKTPPKALSAKEHQALAAELPASLTDALCVDTAALQKAGWSQPPGSRWLNYWRHGLALSAGAPRPRRRARDIEHDTALLALSPDTSRSNPLPPMRDALWRCELVHQTLVGLSARDRGTPSPCLSGCDEHGVPLHGHGHAILIPMGLERPDRIDHIALHAPMGFDERALWALQRIRETYAHDLPRIFVSLVALGRVRDMADRIPPLATARTWISHTPFVPPRYLKRSGKNSLVGQVRAELASRGLPEPVAEVIVDGPSQASRWRHFRRVRRHSERKPPIASSFGLRLTFAEPVSGPICLGYASHYGLGVCVPAPSSPQGAHP